MRLISTWESRTWLSPAQPGAPQGKEVGARGAEAPPAWSQHHCPHCLAEVASRPVSPWPGQRTHWWVNPRSDKGGGDTIPQGRPLRTHDQTGLPAWDAPQPPAGPEGGAAVQEGGCCSSSRPRPCRPWRWGLSSLGGETPPAAQEPLGGLPSAVAQVVRDTRLTEANTAAAHTLAQ